jgi:uncharacterized membrane protein YjjP (DUF1212 family)
MDGDAAMTSDERCNLILAFARTLFVNGQATDQVMAAAQRLGRAWGLHAVILPRWGEVQLQSDGKDGTLIRQVAADPAGVNMDRVASTTRAIEEIESGRLKPDAAIKRIGAIARAPPTSTWLFALAAAAGATALSVIFGIKHFVLMALIFASTGAGRHPAPRSGTAQFKRLHSAALWWRLSPDSSARWRPATI